MTCQIVSTDSVDASPAVWVPNPDISHSLACPHQDLFQYSLGSPAAARSHPFVHIHAPHLELIPVLPGRRSVGGGPLELGVELLDRLVVILDPRLRRLQLPGGM